MEYESWSSQSKAIYNGKIMNMNKVRTWGPVFLWAAVIFWFSSRPTMTTTEIIWQDFFVKKSAHIIEYAIFMTLWLRALTRSGYSFAKSIQIAFPLVVLYALSDEYHQSWVPGRGPHLRDVGFDTIGAASATYLIWFWLPRTSTKLKTMAANWGLPVRVAK